MEDNHSSKQFEIFYIENEGSRVYPETIRGASLEEAIRIFEKTNINKKVIENITESETVFRVGAEIID